MLTSKCCVTSERLPPVLSFRKVCNPIPRVYVVLGTKARAVSKLCNTINRATFSALKMLSCSMF